MDCKLLAGAAIGLFAMGANAQWWNPEDPQPKYRGTPFETKPTYDRMLLGRIETLVHVALEEGNVAKVERMYDEFLASGRRTTDGGWMHEAVQKGLNKWLTVHDETRLRAFFADWKQKVPDSKLRPVAEADAWQSLAWAARGGGYASTVTNEGWDLFKERMAKASSALEASRSVGGKSPYWYWVALSVAGSGGAPEAEVDALFEEAVTRFPSYQPLYYARLVYLMPQWGGDFDKIDRFIESSARRTAATEGDSFYAWLYTTVAQMLGRDTDFFKDTRVSWPRLRDALADLTKRYPDVWNRGLYAGFACRARDRETTAKLLLELPPDARVFAYRGGISLDTCRRFAHERM